MRCNRNLYEEGRMRRRNEVDDETGTTEIYHERLWKKV